MKKNTLSITIGLILVSNATLLVPVEGATSASFSLLSSSLPLVRKNETSPGKKPVDQPNIQPVNNEQPIQPIPDAQPIPVNNEQPIPDVQPIPVPDAQPIPVNNEQPIPDVQPIPVPDAQPIPVNNEQPIPDVQPIPDAQPIPVNNEQPIPDAQPIPVVQPIPVAQPIDSKPTNGKPVDKGQPTDPKANGNKPTDPKPNQGQPTENPAVEIKPINDDPKANGNKPTDPKPNQGQPTENPPIEIDPINDNPTDSQPIEGNQPIEPEPIENPPIDENPPVDDNVPIETQPVGHKPPKPVKPNKKLEKFGLNAENLENLDSQMVADLPEEAIEAFEPENFEALSEEAVQGLQPKHLNKADKKALKGLKAEQIKNLPPTAFAGFTPDNFGGLEPEAIGAIDETQLDQVPDEVAQNLPEEEAAELLANLDPNLETEKVRRFLPPGWIIGQGHRLTRPSEAPIALPPLPLPEQAAAAVKIAQVVNLNAGFGLGGEIGEGDQSPLADINDLLEGTGFVVEQQPDDGILTVENSEQDLELSFLPDADEMIQGPEGAEPGISTDEATGQYILTLEDGEQLPINPAPKDPDELVNVLPENSEVEIGEEAETIIRQPDPKGKPKVFIGRFNPFVLKNQTDLPPGIHRLGQRGVDEKLIVVYQDGTQQEVYPTIQSPDEFEQVGEMMEGVKSIEDKMDGTMNVIIDGAGEDRDGDGAADDLALELIPSFDIEEAETDTEETDSSEGEEEAEPMIEVNDDGTVSFTNQEGDVQTLYIGEVKPVPAEEPLPAEEVP